MFLLLGMAKIPEWLIHSPSLSSFPAMTSLCSPLSFPSIDSTCQGYWDSPPKSTMFSNLFGIDLSSFYSNSWQYWTLLATQPSLKCTLNFYDSTFCCFFSLYTNHFFSVSFSPSSLHFKLKKLKYSKVPPRLHCSPSPVFSFMSFYMLL